MSKYPLYESLNSGRSVALADVLASSEKAQAVPVPTPGITGLTNGHGHGNLPALMRYWRPIMLQPGGFRRCLVILANHPELYPLPNMCAWLHHETTGLWPNQGCHHPGMRNCRHMAARAADALGHTPEKSLISAELARKIQSTLATKSAYAIPNSFQNEVEFKALAYATADGSMVRVKNGLVHSPNPIVRVGESLVSTAVPGDASRLRSPLRSALYRALTPGGSSGTVGTQHLFRCPPGFANGGRFTNAQSTTCGAQLFKPTESTPSAPASNVNQVVNGVAKIPAGAPVVALDAPTPAAARGIPAGRYVVPPKVVEAAAVAPVAGADAAARTDAAHAAVSDVVAAKTTGRLVRRDGTSMNLNVPLAQLANVRTSADMKGATLVTKAGPTPGLAEIPVLLSTDLHSVNLGFHGGASLMIQKAKQPHAGQEADLRKLWAALPKDEMAIQHLAEASKGLLTVTPKIHGVGDPGKMVEIERGPATRAVPDWIFRLFLEEHAPARNGEPWKLVKAPA